MAVSYGSGTNPEKVSSSSKALLRTLRALPPLWYNYVLCYFSGSDGELTGLRGRSAVELFNEEIMSCFQHNRMICVQMAYSQVPGMFSGWMQIYSLSFAWVSGRLYLNAWKLCC